MANALPTQIDASQLNDDQQRIHILKLQIQEATMKLQRPDLGIPADPRQRSPSPEPVYNNKGVRINTRIDRTKSKLTNQRNDAIEKLKALDPTYQPPSNFNFKPKRIEDRVDIPADQYPDINFMGLLLGPRGKALEALKDKTGCLITIRGKGTLKSGMTGINKDGRKFDALDEPMHAFITGPDASSVKKAADEIRELVEMQIYAPDSEKAVALRAKHMHDLAVLNGTVKDSEIRCLNCGRVGHKSWQCDESSVFTASVICSACGGVGHVTSDCRQRRPGAVFAKAKSGSGSKPAEVIDEEYDSFIDDILGKKESGSKKDDYVPPMGDLKGALKPKPTPLMLTSTTTPGAESARVRAITSGNAPETAQVQTAGGSLRVLGNSIFGGKMTKLTAGFKSKEDMERERLKKREEAEMGTPVPMEWKVERLEKRHSKWQEEEMERLEAEVKRARSSGPIRFDLPPPPPPPGSSSSSSATQNDELPSLVGKPLDALKM